MATPLHGFDFFRAIGSPVRVCAPMVDASELPFRMLVRRYGAELCYTPMLHSGQMLKAPSYLNNFFSTCPGDRPLIAQFCGNDPATVLRAALLVQDRVDAVDLNLGCPQGIARKGHYGSFLLEETALVVDIISTLVRGLRVPVTCKIRRLPEDEKTLQLVLALQAAGCSLINIHGRTRFNTKDRITATDWDIIRLIKAHPEVKIPILANGSIAHLDDIEACRTYTGCDGVMTSEALLENPALFTGGFHPQTGARVSSIDLALEYMQLATELGGADVGCVKGHLIKILFGVLSSPPFHGLRGQLAGHKASLADFWPVLREIERNYKDLKASAAVGAGDGAALALAPVEDTALAAAASAQSSAMSREGTWRRLRQGNPTLGVSHPHFLADIATPGLWYMRHRKGFSFDEAGGDPASLNVIVAALDAAQDACPLPSSATQPVLASTSADATNDAGVAATTGRELPDAGEMLQCPSIGSKRSRSPSAIVERDMDSEQAALNSLSGGDECCNSLAVAQSGPLASDIVSVELGAHSTL